MQATIKQNPEQDFGLCNELYENLLESVFQNFEEINFVLVCLFFIMFMHTVSLTGNR